jgi:AraC-like DNA-binding protein
LYPAKEAHREFIDSSEELAAFFIGFSNDWNSSRLHLKDSRNRMEQLFEWLYAERDSYYEGIDQWNDSVLKLILEEYARLSRTDESNLVEEARRYIRRKIDQPLSLDDLAANATLSKYHFLREYERLCGLTPMADVRRMRLRQARNYILSTNDPLKVIAARVGIVSENHLSRLLKETFGIGARKMRHSK